MALTGRLLFLICVTSACWAFSWGFGTQIVTHWLNNQDYTDTVIGLVQSFYYFGMAAGSFAVPWLTRRFGPAACASIGMIIAGATLAAFPLGTEPTAWYALRFVNGLAGALSVVPLETIVSRDSGSGKKTTSFAFYCVSLTIGGALGIGIALKYFDVGTLAFCFGGAIALIAGVILRVGMRSTPRLTDRKTSGELGWLNNFLSYGTAWFQGFVEGAMLSFLSLFLLARGFSSDTTGKLMSASIIGVILFQVPVGWIADRWGKLPMLLACYVVAALGSLAIPWISDATLVAVSLFIFGACTGAMYPLGLSLLGDRLDDSTLPRAYAWYLAIECIGSQAGAAATGYSRDLWGENALFGTCFAALLLVLSAWLGLRWRLRQSIQLAPSERRMAA